MKYLFTLLFTIFIIITASAQSDGNVRFAGIPVWIQMMQDSNVNYFQALKAFRDFWKDKKLPCEAGEEQGMDAFEVEVGLKDPNKPESKRERRRENRNNADAKKYAYEVKQFRGWVQEMKPWVKEDGTIMSLAERQNLIDRQRLELKEVEENNKH